MTQTFPCLACGAPNEPEAGLTRMACSYCGANLTIPEAMQIKEMPKVDKSFTKAESDSWVEIDAPEMLRKSQPIAIGAWNLFAMWTWLKWLIPTCFVLLMIGCIILAIVIFSF
ncbi:MAG: hypothetical protein H7Y59_14000 [Anaerolineales bacterium]|nr:hypothetical protein [Anaerolineales bacterium]